MSGITKIEWTNATWNPITGCSVVSPGCTNCYAMRLAGGRLRHTRKYKGLTQPSGAGPVWNGEVRFDERTLTAPLSWRQPRRIFVNSMSDLFHEDVPDEWIDKIFNVMARCPQHSFQVLTKRPKRQQEYVNEIARFLAAPETFAFELRTWRHAPRIGWPLPNVWIITSVEDQDRANERIPYVLDIPAAVRGVSCEPLLGPIDLDHLWTPTHRFSALVGQKCVRVPAGTPGSKNGLRVIDPFGPRLDWVIVGGESGPGARPMHPDWARSIRDQCQAAGVAFFFKQWGEWLPVDHAPKTCRVTAEPGVLSTDGTWRQPQAIANPPKHVFMLRVGKKAAGRELDGRTWDEYPHG